MIVVIDTNVLIKSLIFDDEWCNKMLEFEAKNRFKVALNEDIYNEISVQFALIMKEMEYKKCLDQSQVFFVCKKLTSFFWRALKINHNICTIICTEDKDDNKFIDCAIESKADYIVSENGEHLHSGLEPIIKKNHNHSVKILNSYHFVNELHKIDLQAKYNSQRITR